MDFDQEAADDRLSFKTGLMNGTHYTRTHASCAQAFNLCHQGIEDRLW